MLKLQLFTSSMNKIGRLPQKSVDDIHTDIDRGLETHLHFGAIIFIKLAYQPKRVVQSNGFVDEKVYLSNIT